MLAQALGAAFRLAEIVAPHVRLLEPLATAEAMEAEARKMDNCLHNLVWQAAQGYRIYFRLRGRTPVTAELIKAADGWKPGQICGPHNQPVELALRAKIEQELVELGQTLMGVDHGMHPDRLAPAINRMRAVVRCTFQKTEIDEIAEALRRIRGRSRAWTDGAYAIFTAESDGSVQFMSDVDGDEYLGEIISHKYRPDLGDLLDAAAVDAIEGTGFLWPRTTANFLRWFPISGQDDCLALAELTLALLARVYRDRTGQPVNVTVRLPLSR